MLSCSPFRSPVSAIDWRPIVRNDSSYQKGFYNAAIVYHPPICFPVAKCMIDIDVYRLGTSETYIYV